MTRGKKPPETTALVLRSGPPDAAIVNALRIGRALSFTGKPYATAVCTRSGDPITVRLAWEDAEAVDVEGSYLLVENSTYEILGGVRASRFFLKEGVRLAAGARLSLIPCASA